MGKGKNRDLKRHPEWTAAADGKIFRIVLGILIGIVAVVCIFRSAYQVKEQEAAVVLTFGNAKAVTESGLHFKWPFQQVKKVDTTILGMTVGYTDDDEWLEEESLMITSDYNFINVDFYVEYKVSDPIKAIYASEDPKEILKNMAQSCIRTVIGSTDVDAVLTTGKSEIQAAIKDMITARLEDTDIGIYLVNITMQDAEPPTDEVMQAFKAVETAKQGMETAINNANRYKNEQIPKAEAEVDRILQEAEGQAEELRNEAEGQAARFNSLYAEYIKYPEVTKKRMFYEIMEDILPDLKVIIDGSEGSLEKIMLMGDETDTQNVTAGIVEEGGADE